jgi:5'-3' exonuclease
MKNLTLLDASVLIYQTYYRHERSFNPKIHSGEKTVEHFADKLYQLFKPAIADGFEPVLIYDRKDADGVYWRQKFIEENQEEHTAAWTKQGAISDQSYKGNRKAKHEYSELLDIVKEAGERLKLHYKHLIWPGLEADDLAGLVCQYKPHDLAVDLVTVDRDWAGLTDKERNIRWINMLPKKRYTIETEDEVAAYFRQKLDKNLIHPSEAYFYKRMYAEAGDNLPANCRIELLDLVNFSAPISMGFEDAHEYVKEFLGVYRTDIPGISQY